MKLKTLIVSVIALAVLSAVVFIARRPGPPPSKDARIGQPIADRATVEKAAKLRISDQGKSVTLVRQNDGTWRDASYYEMPVDFAKLSGFVSSLTDAKLDRLVTSNPDRIARLEFKDTRIELLDNADKPVWTLSLGKSAETGGGRFVRFDDEKKAYLATLNAWLDTDAKGWANAELLALKADDVAKIETQFPAIAATAEPKGEAVPASSLVLSRARKGDAWTSEQTPQGQRVKADRVSALLGSIGTIRFTETNDPADPAVAVAKANQREFKLTTFDGKTYTVALGRKPEEKKLKPPTPGADGKTGPASLGSIAELAKKDAAEKKPEDTKPAAPEFETIPAGPVFVSIASSDPNAPVNALMQKRAFQTGEYLFSGLPQKPDELFEPAPAAAPSEPAKPANEKPDAKKPSETK